MNFKSKKEESIFFAIPCGEFYSLQNRKINEICKLLCVKSIIVEDHTGTDELWRKIVKKIDKADYFVVDIFSKSRRLG